MGNAAAETGQGQLAVRLEASVPSRTIPALNAYLGQLCVEAFLDGFLHHQKYLMGKL